MQLECPHCGDAYTYDPETLGHIFNCRYCGLPVQPPGVQQLPPDKLEELQNEYRAARRKAEKQTERERKKAEKQDKRERKKAEAEERRKEIGESAAIQEEGEQPISVPLPLQGSLPNAEAPPPQMTMVARAPFHRVRWVVAGALASLVLIAFVTVHNSATPKIRISDIFHEQLMRLLEVSGELEAATSMGVNILTLREHLTKVESSWEIVSATWPEGFEPNARESFQEAITGWELALQLWAARIEKLDAPTEPNINGYAQYVAYAGDLLDNGEWSEHISIEEYRGRKKIYQSEANVGVLLSLASGHSKTSKARLLAALSKNR
jgi:hypothetical protein